jgi:hypothetical protein
MVDADRERPGSLDASAEGGSPGEADPPEVSSAEHLRAQVLKMVESDWTNAELREIGITRELAAELGIRHARFGHFS